MADISAPSIIKPGSIAILLGVCVLLFFWGLGDLPFSNRGESREGIVVSEMYSSGNWILPVVNGEYIPFKPPLFHWFGVIAAELLGRIDEFTLRLPSAVFATLGVLLTYFVAARLWGERAGFVSGVVLATSAEWWQAGTDTQVDMTLAFFIGAACWYFYFLYQQREFSMLRCLVLPLLLALATLAKGPIGVVVPSLVFLIFLWLRHDFAFVRKLHPFASAAVFCLVAGSWYGLALWQGGPAFFLRQIVDENFRTAAGTYGHYQPFYYFIPIFLENTLPWSFFFPSLAIFLYNRCRKLSDEQLLFPLVWLVTIFIFFTMSLGKRGVYILPLYPALALLFGVWWRKLEVGETDDGGLARFIGFLIGVSSLLVFAAFLVYLAGEHGLVDQSVFAPLTKNSNAVRLLRSLTAPSAVVLACLVLFGTAAVCLLRASLKRNWRVMFTCLAVLAAAFTMVMKNAFYPPIVFERTLKPFMVRVTDKVNPKIPLVFYRAFDAGAIFYARRHIPAYEVKANELKPPFFLLMWEEDWKGLAERSELKMVDISEGRGPVGRHRLVLVKSASVLSLPLEQTPIAGDNGSVDNRAE